MTLNFDVGYRKPVFLKIMSLNKKSSSETIFVPSWYVHNIYYVAKVSLDVSDPTSKIGIYISRYDRCEFCVHYLVIDDYFYNVVDIRNKGRNFNFHDTYNGYSHIIFLGRCKRDAKKILHQYCDHGKFTDYDTAEKIFNNEP